LAYRPLVTSAEGFGFQRLKPFQEAAEQKRWVDLKEAVLAQMLEKRKQYPNIDTLKISGSDINNTLDSSLTIKQTGLGYAKFVGKNGIWILIMYFE
jgi:putative N6-adenine-specific DNA methylase